MTIFSTLLISMFVTIALIPLFKGLAEKVQIVDIPEPRKVHTYPMPRSGGMAMALGSFIPVVFWVQGDVFVKAVLAGAATIVLLGLADDILNLNYKVKFAGQIIAALMVIVFGGIKISHLGLLLPENVLLPEWLAIVITIVVIIGVTNAINLSDGLDGLAGGISLLSFICIGYLGYQTGNFAVVIFSVAIVGAIFGFLRFNTFPATVFMGDAGSQLLGFLAITLSLGLTQNQSVISPVLPLLLLGFPILDTITVLSERISEGRHPFQSDKNHFHHKLMRLGLYHTEAVFLIYMLQAFLVTYAFLFRFHSEWFLLISYVIFSALILTVFLATGKSGWKFKRQGYFDEVIKGKLKVIKEGAFHIRFAFGCLKYGLPLLLLATGILSADIPLFMSFFTTGMMLLILLIWFFKRDWIAGSLRVSGYLLIPFLVYLSEKNFPLWFPEQIRLIYNLSFLLFIFMVIITLKFTRRTKGFKSSPMDFLILFIALIVPNLPDAQIKDYHLGMIATKIIVLFFSYDVLIGELRGRLGGLVIGTLLAMIAFAIKGYSF